MGKILGRLGVFGAAIAPPVAALGFLQSVQVWAKAHPVLALLALVSYEIVVLVIGFVSKLFGSTTDELGARWKEVLARRIDLGLRRRLSRFERRYRDSVLGSLRFIDLKGLATVGFYTPQLDEVFVDVSLVYSEPSLVPTGVLGESRVDPKRRFIGDLIDKQDPVVLAVIGAPGCGKTTLLRHTALLICRKGRRRRRRVPVLLYLRDHIEAITHGASLPGLINPDAPDGWFEQKLRAGAGVVLLDGLDEVADQANRREVADWAERQITSFPLNDFVISSRPHGYQSAPVSGANVVQVRGFTDEQVSRFVRGWYLAFEQRSTGAKSSDVTKRAADEADDLLERLHHNSALYELTVNPLLLTMIANVHKFRGALPGSRVDLYSEICQVLLWRRQEAKKLASELTGDQKMALLSGLAYSMLRQKIRDVTREEMTAEFRPFLRRMAGAMDAENFLSEMTSSGLLLERERNVYTFAHLTFQEFLAAHHVREKQITEVLVTNVDDVWWRETTLMHVARANADPVVEACLKSGTVAALSLAFDCSEQGSELAPELRAKLDGLLETVFDKMHSVSAARKLMIGVVVSRHVRKLVRTAEGSRTCAEPVSAGLYRLFCERFPCREPDAPNGIHAEPVAGVRSDDAKEFVHWVNELTGSEPGFRLPRVSELESSPVRRKLGALRTWNMDSDKPWPPDPTDYAIKTQLVYEAIYVDLSRLEAVIDICKRVKVAGAAVSQAVVWWSSGLQVLKLGQVAASTYDESVGRALARTIEHCGGIRTPEFTNRFRAHFVSVVNDGQAVHVVPPDTVAEMVEAVRIAPLTPWGDHTLRSFVTECHAVFRRIKPLTPELAAELRIAAMCLAMESDDEFAEIFRRIAAGVLWLDLRTGGKLPASETIVLATD